MIPHEEIAERDLRKLIRSGSIALAGNRQLKIYGLLSCRSGKRMKQSNRVFFSSYAEAVRMGYRPCGHCMRMEYAKWKGTRSSENQH
ncbi:Ada metal-binding domain-containing protein [Chryseolinea sp. T2]|uniref:Ada metal-binding domain-containing protein n=1 Tax=Chryseolinea sp. T2 TaxID=3129255 RepID=UPI00307797B0